jgi:hypothetical protein
MPEPAGGRAREQGGDDLWFLVVDEMSEVGVEFRFDPWSRIVMDRLPWNTYLVPIYSE